MEKLNEYLIIVSSNGVKLDEFYINAPNLEEATQIVENIEDIPYGSDVEVRVA